MRESRWRDGGPLKSVANRGQEVQLRSFARFGKSMSSCGYPKGVLVVLSAWRQLEVFRGELYSLHLRIDLLAAIFILGKNEVFMTVRHQAKCVMIEVGAQVV